YDLFPSFEGSKIKRCDQVIWLFEFYKVEDPEHLFGEDEQATVETEVQQVEIAEQELIE
ncbi:hypothetical protein ACJX0J_014077, partial [Zea mays]